MCSLACFSLGLLDCVCLVALLVALEVACFEAACAAAAACPCMMAQCGLVWASWFSRVTQVHACLCLSSSSQQKDAITRLEGCVFQW